jgi:phage recombination protein Bet
MNANLEKTEMKNNEIVIHNKSDVQTTFNSETVNLIKNTVAPANLSIKEFEMFIYQANKSGLDPLSRQIYCMKSEKTGKVSIQATIDGFRLIAERTGLYQGQTPVMWCGEDGKWVDVWLKKEYPAAAKVGVLKKGFLEPLYAIARFDSYAQRYGDKLNFTWSKMPDLMIGKCAEALALRKAFPQETSNLYLSEEMSNFIDEPETKTVKKSDPAQPTFAERFIQYVSTLKSAIEVKETYEKAIVNKSYANLSDSEKSAMDLAYLDKLNEFEKVEMNQEVIEPDFSKPPIDVAKEIVKTFDAVEVKDVDYSEMKEFKELAEKKTITSLKGLYESVTGTTIYNSYSQEYKDAYKSHYDTCSQNLLIKTKK